MHMEKGDKCYIVMNFHKIHLRNQHSDEETGISSALQVPLSAPFQELENH